MAPGCRPSLALWMIRVKTRLSLGRPSLAPWTIRVKTHLSLGRVDGATSVISFLKAMTSISSANRTLVAGARQWLLRFSFFSLFQKKILLVLGWLVSRTIRPSSCRGDDEYLQCRRHASMPSSKIAFNRFIHICYP